MNSFEKDLEKLCRNNKHIYIYGAGLYARNMYKILDSYKVEIEGFLVTSKETDEELFGLPVIESKSIINSDIGLVIGLGKENTLSVLEYLKDMGFCMDNVVVNKDFFRSGEKGKYIKKRPLLEITTVIGCKVACEYCPQKTLISAYGTSDGILSLESFKFILEKIPANCDISFGGMAEPFLNPMCIDMIEEASKQHRIEVMTTLVGMDDNTFKRFLESQVSYLVPHGRADGPHGYRSVREVVFWRVRSGPGSRARRGGREALADDHALRPAARRVVRGLFLKKHFKNTCKSFNKDV